VPEGHIRVDHLDVLEELGRGAQAVVYRARRQGVDYALKLLRAQPVAVGDAGTNLRREAAMLTRATHPGLARIHAVGESVDGPYLVMELVQGRTLADLLDEGPLSEAAAATIAVDVAGALGEAHRLGLIHRDVKPQNVMVLPDGHAKIIDFGLAARVDDVSKAAAGTFAYVAPEQTGMLNRLVDGRADLYALGVVLYQCLTGQLPFTSPDLGELLRMHATVPAPDLRQVCPRVSWEFAAVVAKLLAKDPDDRYQSGAALIADLQPMIGDEDPEHPTGAEQELVGRDTELAELRAWWRRARRGDGAACLIRGAAGVGKTRLAAELAGDAAADSAIVLHGASGADDAVPLAPLRDAVDRYLRELERLPEPARTDALHRVREAARPIGSLLRPFSPALAVLLGDPGGTGEESPDQFALAVARFLADLARRAPAGLLLHLDDAQHLDADTRRVLHHLAGELPGTPMLVLTCARGDVTEDWCAATRLIELPPLGDAATRRLVAASLAGAAVPDALTDQIVTRSDGNPLMATEYLRAVMDAGLLSPYWGSWQFDATGLDALNLPDDALELVVTRVQGLDLDTHRLLIVAAAIGIRFHPAQLARVCGLDEARALDLLAAATDRRLIGPHEHGRQTFLHDRIRTALLRDVEEAYLRRLHQRIATVLAAEDCDEPGHVYAVARHHLQGEPARDPRATHRACVAAGTLALAQLAPDQALEFLRTADSIATTADLTPDADFLGALGTAYLRTGHFTEALAYLERAVAAEPDPLRRGAHHLRLSEAHRGCWNIDASIGTASQGLAELGRPLPTNRMLLLLTTIASLLAAFVVKRLPVRPVTGARRDRLRMQCALLSQVVNCAGLRPDLLFIACLGFRQVYPATRLGRSSEWVGAYIHLAGVALLANRPRRADRLYQELQRTAEELGDPVKTATVRWSRALLEALIQDPSRANTEALRRFTEDEGRWLPVDDYLSGVAGVAGNLSIYGHARETLEWCTRKLAGLADDAGAAGNPTVVIPAIAEAMTGRDTEARQRLQRVRDFIAGNEDNWSQWVQYALTAAAVAVELDELGEPLDRVLADMAHLKITPSRAHPTQRILWVSLAYGRLEQCRTASAEDRPARLAAAKAAVEATRKLGRLPMYRVHHLVLSAGYRHLAGDHRAALRLLAEAELKSHDFGFPLLDYEIARFRARALHALGHTGAARRYAASALAIATSQQWEHRTRWIRAEFRIGDTSLPGASAGVGSIPSFAITNERFRRRLDALQQVSLAAATVLDPQQLARVALDETIRIFGAERAFLWLLDESTGHLAPHIGRDSDGTDLAELTGYSTTLVDRVRSGGDALVFTADSDGRSVGSESAVAHGLRSVMVAPLRLKDRLLGLVYLDSRVVKGIFTDGDVDILVAITNHVAVSLETARAAQLEAAVRAAQQQRDLAETVRTATTELSSTLDPDQVLETMLHGVTRAVRADSALLCQPGPSGFTVTAVCGEVAEGAVGKQLDVHGFMDATAPVRGGREAAPWLDLMPDATAWIALPLTTPDGPVGLLVVGSNAADAFTDAQAGIVAALAGQAMVAYDKAGLFQRVRQLATQDGLTGVANRRHLLEQAEQRFAEAGPAGFAVIMVDIDHFKKINDTYGHQVGDDVIREVANRLREVVRPEDLLGRYGGEEFLLAVPADEETAGRLADRLLVAVNATPVATQGDPVDVTASIGVGFAGPADADLGVVIGRADQALYAAKGQGRNCVVTH
jgi:eukaryotic-like serine/threonine-protein kinase